MKPLDPADTARHSPHHASLHQLKHHPPLASKDLTGGLWPDEEEPESDMPDAVTPREILEALAEFVANVLKAEDVVTVLERLAELDGVRGN